MAETRIANRNAVTLVRVSTKKQGGVDRFGMQSQRASNARIVAEQGFEVRRTVEYKDVSGDAVLFTDEMKSLQQYLRTPEMKNGNVVAFDLSRLLRPNFSDYVLLQVFVDQRISIFLPQHTMQLWTPEGRMLASVMCAVAFNEAERIRARCMGGREESLKAGYCAAGSRTVLTGWTWDAKTKKWGKDPIYAPQLVEAARMVIDGGVEANYQSVINKLNFCLRPANPGDIPKRATPSGLRRLLSNRMLIGERVIDKKHDLTVPKAQLYDERDGKLRKRPIIAREPHERYTQDVPPLISHEDFEKLQAIIRAKSDARHQLHVLAGDREKVTYRGLLFCAECGRPIYTVNAKGGYKYYRCRDGFVNRSGTRTCKSSATSMRKAELEAELERVFSKEFPSNSFFKKLLREHGALSNRKEIEQRRHKLDSEQEKLESKRARIIDAEIEGTITKQDRDLRLKKVNTDLDANRREHEELEHKNAPLPTFGQWERMARPFKNFASLPVDEKRRLITSRFQEIRVKDGCVVSLYLLTGEVVTPRPKEIEDPTKCVGCTRQLREREIRRHWNVCERCLDENAEWREGQREEQRLHRERFNVPYLVPSGVPAFNDSSQRL